jgi:hypothetical protein
VLITLVFELSDTLKLTKLSIHPHIKQTPLKKRRFLYRTFLTYAYYVYPPKVNPPITGSAILQHNNLDIKLLYPVSIGQSPPTQRLIF